MGKVYLGDTEVGTFDPQTEGTSGDVRINGNVVGSFSLSISGYVYLNGTVIGTYTAISAVLAIPQIRAEIFRGPPKMMDDNFVTGWSKTSGGTSSFSTDGDIATVNRGDQIEGLVEKNVSFETDTYSKMAVRIPSDSGIWGIDIYYDGGWHSIWGSSILKGLQEKTLPSGKTVSKVRLVAEVDTPAKFDYIAICKAAVLIPVDTSQPPGSSYEAESGLTITRPLLELGIAGAQLSFPNLGGAYVGQISKFDRILIYLWRKGTTMKKRFGGKITDRGTSGRLSNFFMNLKCMGLGEQLHAPESLIKKKYKQVAGKTIITEAIAKCSDLTNKFVDADNEIASNHSFEFDEILPFEVINKVCAEAHTSAAVIGFDSYIDPAGNVHTFKREKYISSILLQIEEYNRSRDSHRIRNTITVYGAPDIKDPADEDTYTDYSDPASHNWSSDSGSGTISADSTEKKQGDRSVKHHMTVAGVENKFSFDLHAEKGYYIDGKWIKHEFRQLHVWLRCSVDCDIVANGLWIRLLDKDGHYMDYVVEGPRANVWRSFTLQLGHNAPGWHGMSAFDWDYIAKIQFIFYHASAASDAWVDWFFVSGKRYRATASDSASIGEYGIRWGESQTFDELKSDSECLLKAKSLIEALKEEIESFRLLRTEGSKFTPGDRQQVTIPNDNINNYHRILEIQDIIEGVNWDSVLKISNKPRMIDYVTLHKAQLIVQAIEEERS